MSEVDDSPTLWIKSAAAEKYYPVRTIHNEQCVTAGFAWHGPCSDFLVDAEGPGSPSLGQYEGSKVRIDGFGLLETEDLTFYVKHTDLGWLVFDGYSPGSYLVDVVIPLTGKVERLESDEFINRCSHPDL